MGGHSCYSILEGSRTFSLPMMTTHKDNPVIVKCARCGKKYDRFDGVERLCPKCRARLPRCDSCREVMAREWGYLEGFARKVGKYRICDSCNVELKKNGFLHIAGGKYLLPSGRVKIKEVPAEDKVS